MNLKIVKMKFKCIFGIKAPKNETMRSILKKWNDHGTVHDRTRKKSGKVSNQSKETKLDKVREEFTNNPHLSLRRGGQILNIPKTTLHRVLKEDLRLRPYKFMKRHKIPPGSAQKRKSDAMSLLAVFDDNPQILSCLWCTDEAHFELKHSINHQNDRHWSSHQPHAIAEKEAHPQRTTVWAAMSIDSKFHCR